MACDPVAGLEHVGARHPQRGEIHYLKRAQTRLHRAHRVREDHGPAPLFGQAQEIERGRGEIARDRGLGRAGEVAGVAEGDLSRRDAPPRVIVGRDMLQLHAPDLERDRVARQRQHLVHPVADLDRGDAVARERLDLPHDVRPFVVLERDVVGPFAAVPVRHFLRAVVPQDDRQRQHRGAADFRLDPERQPVVRAPVLAVERAPEVDGRQPAARGRGRVAEHLHVHAEHAHSVAARLGGEGDGGRARGAPGFRARHVVERARSEYRFSEPGEFRGMLERYGEERA